MTTARRNRPRSDTATAAVDAARMAGSNLVPPAHVAMADRDWPYFRSVVAEFARGEWSDHQLEMAAFLARTMADFDAEQLALRVEGSIARSERGTPICNPRKALVQMHAGSILSLRRSLSLHARAQAGEPRDIAKRRALAKETEADNADDDLLASPKVMP
jgi:hypothetical protein